MKYTKDIFTFKTISYSEKDMLVDYGIDLDSAKYISNAGKTEFELFPTGKIGLLAIADKRRNTISVIPAIVATPAFVNENNFGEQYDDNGFAKTMGAAIGSGSAFIGWLAANYYMSRKADYIVNKLAIRFTDNKTNGYLGEIVFVENYKTGNIDILSSYLNGIRECAGAIIDFLQYEYTHVTYEQMYCIESMRDSSTCYDSIRDLIRAARINLINLDVNPKDIVPVG